LLSPARQWKIRKEREELVKKSKATALTGTIGIIGINISEEHISDFG
jgi:hypothetical protein